MISGPFASAQRAHLQNELLYTSASSYTMLNNAIATWGYHDLATPFRQTELDLARLGSNVPGLQIKVYPGGHMTYLDDGSRPLMKADLVRFITAGAS